MTVNLPQRIAADATDLGSDHWCKFYSTPDSAYAGLTLEHLDGDGSPCEGAIPLAGTDAWTLVSVEPVSVSPSLLCRVCGDHGFITDGHWVSA